MKIFEDLHNWVYFKYGVSIQKNTLLLIFILLLSVIFLLFSLLSNNIEKPSSVPTVVNPENEAKK